MPAHRYFLPRAHLKTHSVRGIAKGSCAPRPLAAACIATLTMVLPSLANAQLGPVPAIPLGSINRPNGPAAQGADGTITAQTIRPSLATAATSLGQAVWDHPSIRLFGADCGGAVDDSLALATATATLAGTGADIFVPGDCRLNLGPAARLAGKPIVFDGVSLSGPGGRDSGYPYGTRGGTVLLTDTGGPAFIAKRNWRIEKLIFYWPGQTEAAAIANGGVPITMPPLLTGAAGAGLPTAEISSGEFADNDVLNATTVMDFSKDGTGGLHIHTNRAFFIDGFLKLQTMPLESWVNDNNFTPNAFQSAPGMLAAATTHNLVNWAGSHAADLTVLGNGTAGVVSTVADVDGLQFFHNTSFGMAYGVRVLGGQLNLSHISDNIFDGTAHPISVETGGRIVGASTFSGGTIYSQTFGLQPASPPSISPVVYVSADSAPGGSLTINDLPVSFATGGLVDWEGANGTLDLVNVHADALNAGGSLTPVSAIRFNSSGGAKLRIAASRINNQGTTPGPCVDIPQALQFMTVTDSQLLNCSAPINIGGAFAVPGIVSGNYSAGTTGPNAYSGPGASYLNDVGNAWDKPGPNWSQGLRGSDTALQFTYRGFPAALTVTAQGNLTAPGQFVGQTPFPYTRAVIGATQTFNAPGPTQALFSSVTTDTTGTYANSTFTAPTTGNYDVFASLDQDGSQTVTGDVWTLYINQGGSVVQTSQTDLTVTAAQISAIQGHDILHLAAGDTIRITLGRTSGTGGFRTVADGGRSRFVVHQIQ